MSQPHLRIWYTFRGTPAKLLRINYYWLAEAALAFRVTGDVPHFGYFESVP